MNGHHVTRCSGCGTVLSQCRCPSAEKEQRWAWCSNCDRLQVKPEARMAADAKRDVL